MSITAWENDNSQVQARRRACLSGRAALPDRIAVLVIDCPDHVRELRRAITGQPIELSSTEDPAHGLLLIGRTCPDIVIIGPVHGRLDASDFLEVVHSAEPDLPLIVGIGTHEAERAGHAALLGAAVLAHPYRTDHLLGLLTSLAPQRRLIEIRPLTLDLGRLRIDGAAPRMWLDGAETRLPMREYLLLRYLAERVDAVVSRREIIRAIWGVEDARGSNTLTVHIMRLRRRLHDDEHHPRWIQLVRGLGYQFIIPSPSSSTSDT